MPDHPQTDLLRLTQLRSAEGLALLAEISHAMPMYSESEALSLGQRLRRRWSPDQVAAAMTQARLRGRAVGKFGPDAARMFFTPDGLEQATATDIARRRARRYLEAGATTVTDLCCGIGSDAYALARAGCLVVAVERDPYTAAIATANAEVLGLSDPIEVRIADVTAMDPPTDAVFIDPARRDNRGRRLTPETWSPRFSWVCALAENVPMAGAKVAPGIAHDLVPAGVEAEWVSVEGAVKEAALWWGPLATTARRRATLLPHGDTLVDDGTEASVAAPRRYLYEPDGAVIRAGLVAEFAATIGGTLIDPTIAYVTSDILTPTPFATAYEVTDVMPFSVKALRVVLRARGIGTLTVKKRGSAVTPEELRRQLKLEGSVAATVILTRVAGAPSMLLAQPVDTSSAGQPAMLERGPASTTAQ